MEDYYEYLDSNGVTTLYKLIKDDTVALIDSYSVTVNGITTNLDNHINNSDIHIPISDIENMVDTKISGLVNSAPETLDTLKELSDALGNDPNFATTVANQIGNKANSVHSHVVKDITDFPTIPTKVSDLANDSGYITSVNWEDVTNKPNFSTVATSGSYTDLSNTPTIPTKLSQLENDMGFGTGGGSSDTSDCVHKTGDESIDGIKTFTSMLKVAQGTLQVGSDAGYSVTYGWNGVIISKQPSGTYDIALPKANGTLAIDDNLVHRTGNEAISGAKIFLNDIFRKNTSADLTVTPTGYTNTNIIFTDKNDKTLARIEYVQRPSGVNDVGIFAWDKNGNAHGIHINTNNEVIPLMSSSESYSLGSATYKWGKIYSNDVVHTTGNEYIGGIKSFSSVIYLLDNIINKNNQVDLTVTPTTNLYSHYLFIDKNGKTTAYMQHGKQTSGTDFIGLFVQDKSANLIGVELTTNKAFIPLQNNTYSLGSATNVWNNAYINRINCANIVRPVENSYIYMTAGPSWNNGASIFLNGKSGDGNGSGAGTFTLYARNTTAERYLLGRPDGILNWTGCMESQEFRATTGNAFMAQHSGYTFLIRNDGSNTYLLMSDKDGVPGTWSTARPLIINNSTGVCSINGRADSANYADTATYSTTPATSDNSTRIATTAWVRTYVNSVAGSNTVGSSVSAYWSNSSNVTATGQATAHSSSSSVYPACYSDYVNKTPTVGTIYSGAQLYTEYGTSASATGTLQSQGQYSTRITTTTAQVTFRSPISATGKYLCTTANTVKFRAYTTQGSTSTVGASSIVDYTITKSIFIRVE